MAPIRLLLVVIMCSACAATANVDYGHVALNTGVWNVFQEGRSIVVGAEYRFSEMPQSTAVRVVPNIGGLANVHGANYVYAGLRFDIPFADERFYLTPHTAPGYYNNLVTADLGGPIEFRSGIELSHVLEAGNRIGMNLTHMSNASSYEENPGTESLLFTVQLGR